MSNHVRVAICIISATKKGRPDKGSSGGGSVSLCKVNEKGRHKLVRVSDAGKILVCVTGA